MEPSALLNHWIYEKVQRRVVYGQAFVTIKTVLIVAKASFYPLVPLVFYLLRINFLPKR